MFVTRSLKGAVMFPKYTMTLTKDLQKIIFTNRYIQTSGKDGSITKLLKAQCDIPKSRPAVNACSWCKHHHRKFVTHTMSTPTNYLFQTGALFQGNRLSKTSLNRFHRSINIINYQRRGLATKATGSSKAPLLRPVPPRRVGRIKQTTDEDFHHMYVMAYAVGDELNLTEMRNKITDGGLYDVVNLPRDITDGIMVSAKYKVNNQLREAFFFRYGGMAVWHMSESERHDLWNLARSVTVNPYDYKSIVEESDSLQVVYDSVTKLIGNTLQLRRPEEDLEFDEKSVLHKYTISNALSQSVLLSMNESALDDLISNLEPETQNLRRGVKSTLKKKDINMRQGDLFALRHVINLESGYLDHPDVYWDREELEGLYKDTIIYFSIPKRIKVLNERLNYCSEILELLRAQMNDQQHIRLEWIIIILILIEVMFECIHYAEKCGYVQIGEPYVNATKEQEVSK